MHRVEEVLWTPFITVRPAFLWRRLTSYDDGLVVFAISSYKHSLCILWHAKCVDVALVVKPCAGDKPACAAQTPSAFDLRAAPPLDGQMCSAEKCTRELGNMVVGKNQMVTSKVASGGWFGIGSAQKNENQRWESIRIAIWACWYGIYFVVVQAERQGNKKAH